jgi:hypothetical protein
MAGRSQHATHFTQSRSPILYISEAERDRYRIEGLFGQRQVENIAGKQMANPLTAGEAKHGAGKIDTDYSGAGQFTLKIEREITTPAGQIKDASWLPRGNDLSRAAAPEKIPTDA